MFSHRYRAFHLNFRDGARTIRHVPRTQHTHIGIYVVVARLIEKANRENRRKSKYRLRLSSSMAQCGGGGVPRLGALRHTSARSIY